MVHHIERRRAVGSGTDCISSAIHSNKDSGGGTTGVNKIQVVLSIVHHIGCVVELLGQEQIV